MINMLLLLIEYLRRKGIKIIACLHYYAGKVLTYVVVVIAKYLKLHPEDSFSMYKIQYSMLGKKFRFLVLLTSTK